MFDELTGEYEWVFICPNPDCRREMIQKRENFWDATITSAYCLESMCQWYAYHTDSGFDPNPTVYGRVNC